MNDFWNGGFAAVRRPSGVRAVCLSTSALCGAIAVAAMLQTSSAVAAPCGNTNQLQNDFDNGSNTVTTAPVDEVCTGNKSLDMKDGDDLLTVNANLYFQNNLVVNGGDGLDGISLAGGKTLRVDGLALLGSVETLDIDGRLIAGGGLDYLGSTDSDALLFNGSGVLVVSGGSLDVNALGGNDTITIATGSTINVTGQDANFNGGNGTDTLNINGHLQTTGSGDINITNFEAVTNSGNSINVAGDFSYLGTAAADSFVNSGGLTAGGTASFDGAGGLDSLHNSGFISADDIAIAGIETVNNTGLIRTLIGDLTYTGTAGSDVFRNGPAGDIRVGGNADFDFGGGADRLINAGTIKVTGTGGFNGGAGLDRLINSGDIIADSLTITEFETVINTGKLDTAGDLSFAGTAGGDTFGNTGIVDSGGNAAFNFGGGNDALINGGLIKVTGTATFEGGTGADSLTNSGRLLAGVAEISGFETVTNTGVMQIAGGLTYTGTGVDDLFANGAGGLIKVNGNAGFGFAFGDGADQLNNDGTIRVTGLADFDGGIGADSLTSGGAIVASALTIGGFETVTNSGQLQATIDLTYNGTGGNDLFGNQAGGFVNAGGNALFNFGAGADQLNNDGNIKVTGTATFNGGTGADSLANGGNIAAGTLSITGFETVTNGGVLQATGGLTYTGTGGSDSFGNTGFVIAGGLANFSGGAGLDSLTNSGLISADTLLITEFETVTNGGTLKTTGDLSYAGTAGNDTFSNTALVNSGGNAVFNFGGGNDALTNSGLINVTGAASFEGGTGVDSLTNSGSITADTVAISGFETVANSGLVKAAGDLTYTGTGGNDTFGNTGNLVTNDTASFDGGAGLDSLTNGGAIFSDTIVIAGIETVSNSGLMQAVGGILTYTGTGGNDTFGNTASGILNIQSAATFDFGAGADQLNNAGAIRVIGPASLEGGAGIDSLINSGSIANGGAIIGHTMTISGFETVNNSGLLQSKGDLDYIGTPGNDAFGNTGSVIATGTAAFDGGLGLDSLTNSGAIVAGTATITGIETVTNSGTLKTITGDLTYAGTGGNDTFGNTGLVDVAGNSAFGFGDGADTLTNDGNIRLQGLIAFDGGTGIDSMTNGGDIVASQIQIAGFESVSNSGTLKSNGGNILYTGTGGADSFGNLAGGVIDSGAFAGFNFGDGNDTLTNAGLIKVAGTTAFDGGAGADTMTNSGHIASTGALTINGFETVNNSGRLTLNTGGTINVGAGLFTNSGTIDMAQATPVYGDELAITGDAALPGTLELDISLRDGGVTDHLTVAGDASGAVNLVLRYNPTGSYLLFQNPLKIVDGDPSGTVTVGSVNPAKLGLGVHPDGILIDSSGLINYILKDGNGDLFVDSELDTEKAGGVAGAFTGALTAVNAIFQKPISSYVSSCKTDEVNGRGFGTWARSSKGSIDTKTGGTSTFAGQTGDVSSNNTTDYHGLQGGLDAAACNMGGTSTLHAGLTFGQVEGNSVQTNSDQFLTVNFDSKFIGAYLALIHASGFTADANLRYDFHDLGLTHTDRAILDDGVQVDGTTVSGSLGAAYNYAFGDSGWAVRPGVGVAVSRTSVDSFAVNAGGTFSYDDQVSIMGQAALTINKTFQLNDKAILQPFVSGVVFHEFGDNGSSTLDLGQAVDIETTTLGTFEQLGAGVTLVVFGGDKPTEPNFLTGLRFDAQFGDRLEGWTVTGQARLQF